MGSPDAAMAPPYFSIVIPVYNRAGLVGRALGSCLNQDLDDFEIVVVDDASKDGSADAVRRYDDPRIRLILHETNKGVCPARNTGGRAARGEWIVFLDSDDELAPGALRRIRDRAVESGPGISRLVFMYRMDNGNISPDPPLVDEIWDYERFLRWCESPRRAGDYLNVVRKCAFDRVQFPDSRALEGSFHMEFTKAYRTRSCPDIVGLLHADAENRSLDRSGERMIADASDQAGAIESVLSRHGEALARWAPGLYRKNISGLATLHFLSGRRLKGLECAGRSLWRNPLSLQTWAVLVFGLLGPRALARLRAERLRRQAGIG